jgi:calcineurin-like phosphoesterase family protein
LISDTHFGHRNIVKFQQRPETHEIIMLSEWIKRVQDGDQILHLGDVWMRASAWRWATIISRLPGEKFLILGNHDNATRAWYEKAGFTIIEPFIQDGIAFTHRPISPEFPLWAGEGVLQGAARKEFLLAGVETRDPGEGWHTNIHGHTHTNVVVPEHDGTLLAGKSYVNVCVEHTDLAPIQLGAVAPIQKVRSP